MTGSPYLDRVILLLGAFLVAGVVDKIAKGREANRWREYLFLTACGVAGSCAGIVHDQLTVSISPEYYRLAKEISTPSLRWGAGLLGAQTGFTAGVVLSGIFLLNSKGRMVGEWPRRYLGHVMMYSVLAACLGALIGNGVVPNSWVQFYEVPQPAAAAFKVVVAEHYGLYLGALYGSYKGVRMLRLHP